jgi:hypothetical protein
MPGGTTKTEMRNTFGLAVTTASTPASKQRHPIVEKEERKYNNTFFLPLSLGNIRSGIHRCSNESTRRDKKKGVLVNTPTLAWAYTRTFKDKGKNSNDIVSFSTQTGCSLSK